VTFYEKAKLVVFMLCMRPDISQDEKEILSQMLEQITPPQNTRWYGECPTCPAAFEISFKYSLENPHPNGLICPECRKQDYMCKGVVWFEAKPARNESV
jgi:hypothetical protein